jgi:response regulator RpfG family c-di-GMP phosphodiesterase
MAELKAVAAEPAVGPRPRVLCVDDERNVLDALSRKLRRRFEVQVASGGAEGLETIGKRGPFSVVVSDMRMPGMDGAQFLSKVRQQAPNTVRILLTGHSDLNAAIAAVNEGQIFRFLFKPCPENVLEGALDAAAEHYRLVTAEKELLEQTLRGSIDALSETLCLTSPSVFGRARRVHRTVKEIVKAISLDGAWQVEVAAMLSELGAVALPPDVWDKIERGLILTADEEQMVSRVPTVTLNLLGRIPRLESVCEIIRCQDRNFVDARRSPPPMGARILKLATDLDVLLTQGLSRPAALTTLQSREGAYDYELLEVCVQLYGQNAEQSVVREIPIEDLAAGMILAEDLRSGNGMLLITRGHEVTDGLLERLRNMAQRRTLPSKVRVAQQS